MPLPKPKPSGETNEQWMARCMGDAAVKNDFGDPKQRVAYCINIWRQHHGPAATGPKPKAASPAACYPKPDETQAQFMSRCQDGGDTEEACIMSWNADKASPPAVERNVQMKWMPTTLEVKGLNDGDRTLMGIATTPSVDLVGDVVESMGARYKEPVSIPLLWMHRHDQPVGVLTAVSKGENGIRFQAKIAKVDEPGILRDRVDMAWQSVRAGLVRGVSIGFTPVREQTEALKGGTGYRYRVWDWHELSLVTIPAQSEATIQVIRSLDERARGRQEKPSHNQRLVAPLPKATSPKAAAATQSVVLGWINDFAKTKEWRWELERSSVRDIKDDAALERLAAAKIRSRQPLGDITQEQIRFEVWELSRYW